MDVAQVQRVIRRVLPAHRGARQRGAQFTGRGAGYRAWRPTGGAHPPVVVDQPEIDLLAALFAHGLDKLPDLDRLEVGVLVRGHRRTPGTRDSLVEGDARDVDHARAGLRHRADRFGEAGPEPVAD